AVHGAKPQIEIPVASVERRRARAAHHEDGALRIRAIDAGAEGAARLLDDADEAFGKEMGVDVDAGGLRHWAGILPSMRWRWESLAPRVGQFIDRPHSGGRGA